MAQWKDKHFYHGYIAQKGAKRIVCFEDGKICDLPKKLFACDLIPIGQVLQIYKLLY